MLKMSGRKSSGTNSNSGSSIMSILASLFSKFKGSLPPLLSGATTPTNTVAATTLPAGGSTGASGAVNTPKTAVAGQPSQQGKLSGVNMPDMRTLSEEGYDCLKLLEGLRLKPYDDQTGKEITEWCKGATIGVGHLIPFKQWDRYKKGITQEEASDLLTKDVEKFEIAVRCLPDGLKQQEFDACVLLAYNIGVKAFRSSTVYKILNTGSRNMEALEGAWKSWRKSQGKVNKGLVNRRAGEWKLFRTGEYPHW